MKMNSDAQSNIRFGIQIVIAATMGVGAWYAKGVGDGVRELEHKITAIQIEAAEVKASRFTASDWVRVKDTIDVKFTDHDKRITNHDSKFQIWENEVKALNSKMDQILSYHNSLKGGQ